jgi:hypothetical protein
MKRADAERSPKYRLRYGGVFQDSTCSNILDENERTTTQVHELFRQCKPDIHENFVTKLDFLIFDIDIPRISKNPILILCCVCLAQSKFSHYNFLLHFTEMRNLSWTVLALLALSWTCVQSRSIDVSKIA